MDVVFYDAVQGAWLVLLVFRKKMGLGDANCKGDRMLLLDVPKKRCPWATIQANGLGPLGPEGPGPS